MFSYVLKRLLASLPIVIGASILVFGLIHLIPGDPVASMLGLEADQETIDSLREDLGLDRPLPVQYLVWLQNAVQGDLGRSIHGQQGVLSLVVQKLPATVELTFVALLISLVIAIPTGIVAAIYRNTWLDYLSTLIALFGVSVPSFWLGISLILLVSLRWGLLPPGGYVPFTEAPLTNLRYVVLPALSLGAGLAGIVARMTRASMLEVLSKDYIRVSRAKGLPNRVVVVKHALKNALIPIITVVGLQLGTLLGGAVVIETVFAWPGVGKLVVDAILGRDFPVVQGVTLLVAMALILINLLVDLAYVAVDPRVTYE